MRMGKQAVHQLALAAMMITMLFACGVLHVRAATAATYYVATTGNDANPGTLAQPFQTINKGLSVLHGGDTLYLRGGTYNEGIRFASQNIPSGSSFSAATTIAAYQKETVTLRPSSSGKVVIDINSSSTTYQFIIFDGLIIDAINSWGGVFFGGSAVHDLRLQNSEIKNGGLIPSPGGGGQGVQVFGGQNFEFVNLRVHDNGLTRLEHGFYVCSTNLIIRDSDIYSNSGYGIQVYDGSHPAGCSNGTKIYNNRIHDNHGDGGITLNHGDNIQFYNNIVYNNHGNGVEASYNVSNTKVYNNTVYLHSGGGINLGSGSSGAVIKNNILYQNGSVINDSGAGTVRSNNLTTDPKFVDSSAANFYLQSTSPAIDAGVTLSTVQTDFSGTPRPQGTGADIGAYEFLAGQVPSPTSPGQVPSPTRLRALSVLP